MSEAKNSGEQHRTIPFSELLKLPNLKLTLRGEMEDWLRKVGVLFKTIDCQINDKNRESKATII